MKITYKIPKGLLAAVMGLLILSSCEKDLPGALDTTSNQTVLNSIKIVNAGENGNVVMEGVVDENAKTVAFSRIDTLTDFSNLKFEAEVSDGAKLDKEVYPVTFQEGESEKVIVVKVESGPRYREYLVKLRLKVPVFGADFENVTTYDYTNNSLGNPLYYAFTGSLTRGTGFDGDKVLILKRPDDAHLLNVSDLKNGVTTKIPLNLTGVSGGTYTFNMGAQVNGHTYVASLSGSGASPLKIYHWTDPSAAPQVILDVTTAGITGDASGTVSRYGDNISVNLNAQGNGYIFFGNNAGSKTLRYDVTNYTTVSNPTTFVMPVAAAGSWTSFNQVGNSSEFIFTGHDAPIALISEGGSVAYTMSRFILPIRASDARVVYFNGERYLIMTTAARTGSEATNFYVYDITRGTSIKEALTDLNDRPTPTPVFEYSLQGPVNTAPASQTGFYVKKDGAGKDESLLLYSGANDTGFVIFEFGKKVATDD